MADPLTSTIRLTQPTVGGDSGTWGGLLNSDMAYIDAAINGINSISIAGLTSYTLLAAGDVTDQARYQWYKFTGALSGNCTVTIPSNNKIGIASNGTTGGKNVVLTTGSGTTITIAPGQVFAFYCDGTNVVLMPWGTDGVIQAISVNGTNTLTLSESGAFVEITGGSTYTTTLPSPTSNAGATFFFYNKGTANMTLATPAGTFAGPSGNGASSASLYAGASISIVSDGTNWITYGLSTNGLISPVVSVSGTTTITSSQTGSMVELTGGSYTVTLPNPTTYPGWTYLFFNNSASTNTLSTPAGNFSGPLGSGASTISMTAGVTLQLVSDGTNWVCVDGQVTTTAVPGVFTTLSASSTVSGAGFTALFASPPPIGNTTANTGAFTTLSASSTVSGNGFSTYLASPPAIGGTAPAAGTFNAITLKGATNGYLIVDTTGSSHQSLVQFKDQGTKKWSIGKQTDNTFLLYDEINGVNLATCDTSGNLTIGESGQTLTLNGSVSYGGSLTGGSGAFTTLSASSTVSGTGFVNRFASPGPIGSTAASSGAFTTLSATGLVSPSSTVGVAGTTTNDNAQAGSQGEYISAVQSGGVTLSNGGTSNLTSISLTAGDWDVGGQVYIVNNTDNVSTSLWGGISIASATLPGSGGNLGISNIGISSGSKINYANLGLMTSRALLASTTTYYLVANASFSSGTVTAFGFIWARRAR